MTLSRIRQGDSNLSNSHINSNMRGLYTSITPVLWPLFVNDCVRIGICIKIIDVLVTTHQIKLGYSHLGMALKTVI